MSTKVIIPARITPAEITALATANGYKPAALRTIIKVETPGYGFSQVTGRPLIQFEPAWFKRKYEEWQTHKGVWTFNGIGDQTEEWKAFNDAFRIEKEAAMQSTSIGMMQVMGFHYRTLGFKTVDAMWDFAKVSEYNQILLGIKFIQSIPALDKALKTLDWYHVAYYYNGGGFKELAEREHSLPYDQRLLNRFNIEIKIAP